MEQNIIAVSQVNEYIKFLLDRDELLTNLCVRGEVSNYKIYPSGHHYFTLKDAEGALKCVMFRSSAQRLRFRPENGMQVIAYGRVTVFPRDGAYQLYCSALTADGAGDLYVAFEQLKEKLSREGLFDPAHKKPLPRYPHTIAIITSAAGAAIMDMLRILAKRYPLAKIKLLPVRVQGAEAPAEIAGAIRYANRYQVADLIITGRGGGSMEDLWAFNDERVARAIYASEIPVISAVGHEPDVTISDYVADLRAATPSNAAELAVPDAAGLRLLLQKQSLRMQGTAQSRLKALRLHLGELSKKRCLSSPLHYTAQRRMAIDRSTDRLCAALQKILFARRTPLTQSTLRLQQNEAVLLAKKRHATAALGAKLDAMSPLSVLRRGYSITKTEDGTVLRDASVTSPGSALTITLQSGSVHATVTKTDLPKKEN